MRKGAGPGPDPRRPPRPRRPAARRARPGPAGAGAGRAGRRRALLSATDRGYLALEQAFERELVNQRPDERRGLDETLDRAWRVLSVLPRRELTMLPTAALDAHYQARDDGAEQQEGR